MPHTKHYPWTKGVQLIFGLAAIVGGLIAVSLYGSLFRQHWVLFCLLWLSIPFLAFLLLIAPDAFDLSELRKIRIFLIILVVALSFGVFGFGNEITNYCRNRFVKGYSQWKEPA